MYFIHLDVKELILYKKKSLSGPMLMLYVVKTQSWPISFQSTFGVYIMIKGLKLSSLDLRVFLYVELKINKTCLMCAQGATWFFWQTALTQSAADRLLTGWGTECDWERHRLQFKHCNFTFGKALLWEMISKNIVVHFEGDSCRNILICIEAYLSEWNFEIDGSKW